MSSEVESSKEGTAELPKAYEPKLSEGRWYAEWETAGVFKANTDPADTRPAYVIAIPPPNVTGSLHMGHACRTTFEDVLIRYKRMDGFNALWIPGTDHAGIATQVVVERLLKAEGKSRHDLGREEFVKRVWQWKEESGGRIMKQLRVMGASCDWSRERFTMDPGLSDAVREVFVRLYEEKLIYRATRLINWCVSCRTALSDLEVETEENVQGELFEFAYTLEDSAGSDIKELVVATTRPETMLGDTALAVHPDDPRYQALIGRRVRHPFVDRLIPVIADSELVDPKFGTGVVKVTPAHDPNDFATGKRHTLEEISVFELDGKVNSNGGAFAGLDRFAARKAIKAKLEELGLVRGAKPHAMTLPRCQRCNTVVEPMISTQWFVRMLPLAEPALAAVENGQIQIIPEEWTKTYYHWMRNIQDWCVSRQLWWGHPIPAWYCDDGHVTVSRETPAACCECKSTSLHQDPDVLDTWFSSALWPFSTLGWPQKTADLARFYPTSDLETGFDILFFWVARMIMMGLHFMDEVPFKRVLLSGLVTDERGDKMSKVKGNVIDPLDVIQGATIEDLLTKAKAGGAKDSGLEYLKKTYPEGFAAYGADALRMTLLSYAPQQRKIALSIKRIEGYRNFCNKIWNAARYSFMKLQECKWTPETSPSPLQTPPEALANRWILARLAHAIESSRQGLEEYRLDDATGALYHFVWDDLCDWYLELSKPLLAADSPYVKETCATLVYVLETALRLLHPMAPFVSEEIWQRVPKWNTNAPRYLALADYPKSTEARLDANAEADMVFLQAVVVGGRTIRSTHDVPRSRRIALHLFVSDDAPNAKAIKSSLMAQTALIDFLLNAEVVFDRPADESSAGLFVEHGIRGVVPEVVDRNKERDRLTKEVAKLDKDIDVVTKKLQNAAFMDRAPPELVERERARLQELTAKRTELQNALS